MSRNHLGIHWRARARLRRMALDRDDLRCTICGSPTNLEIHHIRPLSEGGSALALGNVRTLCRTCHIDHHAAATTDPERAAWRAYLRECS